MLYLMSDLGEGKTVWSRNAVFVNQLSWTTPERMMNIQAASQWEMNR